MSRKAAGLLGTFLARDIYNAGRKATRSLLSYQKKRRIYPRYISYDMPTYRRYNRYKRRSKYGSRQFSKRRKLARSRLYRRRQVGFPVRAGTTKRTETVNVNNKDLPSRTMQSYDLTEIELDQTAGVTPLNQRERDIINVRGFKIEGCVFANFGTGAVPKYPHTFHLAVIAERGCASGWTDAANDFVPPDDFLRDYSSARAKDLDTNLSSLELREARINKDKYIVLAHKKVSVIPVDNPADAYHRFGSSKTFKMYIRLNRQVRFENYITNNDLAVAGRVALVVWQDRTFGQPPGTAAASNFIRYDLRSVAYWRTIA